jgi:uncharacterized membrane protein
MNAAYLHILLNHFPLMGMLFGLVFLIVALFSKNEPTQRSGLCLIIFAAVMTIPTYLTGEGAEDIVGHLPTFSEKVLSLHEEAAEKAIWLIGITGLFAIPGLLFSLMRRKVPTWLRAIIFLLTLGSLVATARINFLGGKISHTELRDGGPMNAGDADEKETDRD